MPSSVSKQNADAVVVWEGQRTVNDNNGHVNVGVSCVVTGGAFAGEPCDPLSLASQMFYVRHGLSIATVRCEGCNLQHLR